jgi:hypothetical protein
VVKSFKALAPDGSNSFGYILKHSFGFLYD